MKLPDPPLIAAGALGGPIVLYGVTPMRNALTLAAADQKSTFFQIFRRVFASGISSGWAGGLHMMPPAVPQFCVLGPLFHVYRDALGGSANAAVLATAATESAIAYGVETRNCQM